MSDETVDALCRELSAGTKTPPEVFRDALIVPVLARPGDLETVRLAAELKRLREDLNERVDEIAMAIAARKGE